MKYLNESEIGMNSEKLIIRLDKENCKYLMDIDYHLSNIGFKDVELTLYKKTDQPEQSLIEIIISDTTKTSIQKLKDSLEAKTTTEETKTESMRDLIHILFTYTNEIFIGKNKIKLSGFTKNLVNIKSIIFDPRKNHIGCNIKGKAKSIKIYFHDSDTNTQKYMDDFAIDVLVEIRRNKKNAKHYYFIDEDFVRSYIEALIVYFKKVYPQISLDF
jgi:hypothetical protein